MESNKTTMPQPLDDWFIALLACPGCVQRHPVTLSEDKSSLLCACGKYSFPVKDGIPILLIDNAVVLDENASPESVLNPGGLSEAVLDIPLGRAES